MYVVDRQGFAAPPTAALVGLACARPARPRRGLAPSRVRTHGGRSLNENASRVGGASVRGGPAGVRTLDLGIKSPLLYQLSYRSICCYTRAKRWGGRRDSNPRPPGPQPSALPTELRPPSGHLVKRLDYNAPSTPRLQGVISKDLTLQSFRRRTRRKGPDPHDRPHCPLPLPHRMLSHARNSSRLPFCRFRTALVSGASREELP